MFFLKKRIDMNGASICLNCPQMNPRNGYCPKVSEYVNAFWSCQRFEDRELDEELPKLPHKPKRVSPLKGVKFTANRTHKTCSRCGKVKRLDEFVKCARNSDGHSCYCLECNRIKNQEERAKMKQWKAMRNADNNSNK